MKQIRKTIAQKKQDEIDANLTPEEAAEKKKQEMLALVDPSLKGT